MADPRLVSCRADVPTCGLTCLGPGLGGPTAAIGPASGIVWPHVPDVNVDSRASAPLGDGPVWSGPVMTPAGRLLIRKMDEHLR